MIEYLKVRLAEKLADVATKLDSSLEKSVVGNPLKLPRGKMQSLRDPNYSNDINLIHKDDMFKMLNEYIGKQASCRIIDAGGRHAEWKSKFEGGFDYSAMDIDEDSRAPGVIIADACCCPEIADESFDIYFSVNLFEHVWEPWSAAKEALRIVKPGGMIAVMAPFSWRYHPFPVDLYRFSPDALEYLFSSNAEVDTVLKGFDISLRRKDARGGALPNYLDVPPVDALGGWRENWQSIYVGIKKA